LKVWRVQAIELKRSIGAIQGKDGTGNVVFHDANAAVDIYLPTSMDQVTINYHLSRHFISYCGIIEPKYQQLVYPILSLPLTSIETQLESYDLDGLQDHSSVSSLLGALSDDHEIEETAQETLSMSAAAIPSLRSVIPTLDRSLATVRKAATEYDPGSGFTAFNSSTAHTTASTADTTLNSQANAAVVDTDLIITSSRRIRGARGRFLPKTTNAGNAALGTTPLNLQGINLAGSHEERSLPRRKPVRPSWSGGVGPSSYGGDERSSAQEIYNRQIGLLGETFVGVLPSFAFGIEN
jgi:hypothetical protein